MKLHIYTNQSHDTVALINDQNQVIGYWDANDKGGGRATALEDALYATNPSEWEGHAHEIDVDDFAIGNDLVLIIREDGEWEYNNRDLLIKRLRFHLGNRHPIIQALYA
jgi:hypothetical protein